jgi:cysteine synthase
MFVPPNNRKGRAELGRKFDSILETIGNTLVVRIGKLSPPDVDLVVKIESFNPLGSVKDRLALGVIEEAERMGALEVCKTAPKGSTILCMLPDTGERHLSTPLIADVPVDMTEEDAGISSSTPRFHMAPAG